jgi:hypothetical protein
MGEIQREDSMSVHNLDHPITVWMIVIGAAMAIAIGMSYFANDRVRSMREAMKDEVPSGSEEAFDGHSSYYSSEGAAIQFTFPTQYELSEYTELGANDEAHRIITLLADAAVPENGEGPTAITIQIFSNSERASLVDWVMENALSNYALGNGEMSTRKIGDIDGMQYMWNGLYQGKSIAILFDEKVYVFSVTFDGFDDPILGDFERVVQSVKFAK